MDDRRAQNLISSRELDRLRSKNRVKSRILLKTQQLVPAFPPRRHVVVSGRIKGLWPIYKGGKPCCGVLGGVLGSRHREDHVPGFHRNFRFRRGEVAFLQEGGRTSLQGSLAGRRDHNPGALLRGFILRVLLVYGLFENRRRRANVGGQPVQVFFGEWLGRVAGGVDHADDTLVPENRDCQ